METTAADVAFAMRGNLDSSLSYKATNGEIVGQFATANDLNLDAATVGLAGMLGGTGQVTLSAGDRDQVILDGSEGDDSITGSTRPATSQAASRPVPLMTRSTSPKQSAPWLITTFGVPNMLAAATAF